MGIEFQFGDDTKVLKMDGGDSCTTIWLFLMPSNCTLKNSESGTFYVRYIL